MSATESIFAPYIDRKSKLAVAGTATLFLAAFLGITLVLGLVWGELLLGPLVPSGPTEYAYLMSVHHALPTWGTWLLVYFLSTNVVVTIASWVALGFLAFDTFNLAMAIVRFFFLSGDSAAEIVTPIITLVVLAAFWIITAFASLWIWRILRFKKRRYRTYANVDAELLRGRRPPKKRAPPLTLRGRPSRVTTRAPGSKVAEKNL